MINKHIAFLLFFIIPLLLLLIGISCSNHSAYVIKKDGEDIYYEIINIDSCEYIYILGDGGISHKGNCKNPLHYPWRFEGDDEEGFDLMPGDSIKVIIPVDPTRLYSKR